MDKHNEEHIYVAIDLKSFYASVECRERGKDALTTNLVVADPTRTEKTICLAVSPALKAYGIPGRARLFEVVQRVKEVNKLRLSKLMASGHAAGTVERSRQIEGEQSDRKQSAGEQQKRIQTEGKPNLKQACKGRFSHQPKPHSDRLSSIQFCCTWRSLALIHI